MSIEDRLRHGLAREASTAGVEEALETTFRRQQKSVRRRMYRRRRPGGCAGRDAPLGDATRLRRKGTRHGDPGASVGFEGSWVSHLNRGQVVRQIRAAGLGRWVEEFLVHERLSRHHTFVYTFDGNRFEVADFQRGGDGTSAGKAA